MKNVPKLLRRLAALLVPLVAAFIVIAPSQGGGGVTGTGVVAFGEVSDFGSVFVNGVEYFTDTADIVIDGIHGSSEADLRVGMTVLVAGTLSADGKTGSATRVDYRPDLRGTLDGAPAFGADGAIATVHGIEVRIDDATVVDGALAAAALAAGDRVEISGLRTEGAIYATRITRRASLAGTVLTGRISNVTPATFTLGALQVDYSHAAVIDGLAGLSEGATVRVRSDAIPAGGILSVSEVRVVTGALPNAEASVDGIVARLAASSFDLGGLAVDYSAAQYRNGTRADLVNGARVEVEGASDGLGRLAATRITFPAPESAAADATVIAKTATGFMLVSANGLEVRVDKDTRWKDRTRSKRQVSSLATLAVGDRVTVGGFEVAPRIVFAEQVSRGDPSATVTLAGRVRGADGSAVTVFGLRAAALASSAYADADRSALSADAFFAKVAGRRVKASGMASGNGVAVSGFEIEP